MRKIKSVKLAKEFNNGEGYAKIGAELNTLGDDHYYLRLSTGLKWYFAVKTVIENMTGLFVIEYEPEGFEFRNYPIALPSKEKEIVNSELNRLADWCDGQSEKICLHEINYCNTEDYLYVAQRGMYFAYGLKFNSQQSANLFISELNKPENSNYKNYFIELLKKTRL